MSFSTATATAFTFLGGRTDSVVSGLESPTGQNRVVAKTTSARPNAGVTPGVGVGSGQVSLFALDAADNVVRVVFSPPPPPTVAVAAPARPGVLVLGSETAPSAHDPIRTYVLQWTSLATAAAAAAGNPVPLPQPPTVLACRDVDAQAGLGDNKVLVGVSRTYKLFFSKAIVGFSAASLAGGSAISPQLADGGTTATFAATATAASTAVRFGTLTAQDGGAAAAAVEHALTPVAPLAILRLAADAAPHQPVSVLVRHGLYSAHSLVLSKGLAASSTAHVVRAGNATGAPVSGAGELTLTTGGRGIGVGATWQVEEFPGPGPGPGNSSSTPSTLVLTNARDEDGFLYPILSLPIAVVSHFHEYGLAEDVFLATAGSVSAVHLDVEPHTLPEWGSDTNGTANQFLDMLEGCKARLAGKLPLVVDVPIWFDSVSVTRSGSTRPLSEWIQDVVDVYNILAFRDTAAAILSQTATERAYAVSAAKRYSLSVETDTALGGEPLSITFGDETPSFLEQELAAVDAAASAADGAAFAGMAIHTWGHFRGMLLSAAGLAPDSNATVAAAGNAAAATGIVRAAVRRDVYEWDTNLALNAADRADFLAALNAGALASAVRDIFFGSKNLVPFDPSATCTFVNAAAAAGKSVQLLFGNHPSALSTNHAVPWQFCAAAATYAGSGRTYVAVAENSPEWFTFSVRHSNAASATRHIGVTFTGAKTLFRLRITTAMPDAFYPSGKSYSSLAAGGTLTGTDYGAAPETDTAVFFVPATSVDPLIGTPARIYVTFTVGVRIYAQVLSFTVPVADP